MISESSGNVLASIQSRYKFRSKTLEYSTSFYPDRFVIFYKDRKAGEIPYESILRVEKNREGLKFGLKNGSRVKIPCTSDERRKVFRIFKAKRLGSILNENDVIGLALVEFADLKFLVPLVSTSFTDLKKNVIRRIGGHFLPSQNLDFISLDHYDEFSLYIKDKDSLVTFENDDDLLCSLLYFEKKLTVVVKHVPKVP
ncbi:hypothetical protein [Encephalitozoon cuniculi GB-M1]|uniref:Uncharacterized protein n=2 Tax=Encephalitozoon cuniculi TaxID=6035 RepID=Q8STK4_ENCCU|nr:uncharacterized protein ECU09_1980 [Encephalitozoon cuniculi GB-M1]AGE96338.1 hypothetical protein ECU09_1980 [Encephalitozoon cuniculi]KMV65380.1 hypothetical protein M970_092020 [Encephalitozoon cuniculi EcunIII-L]UYI26897.1 hypothetical protein J0A71_03g07370 [Encephalitozoon cuniculi]CAD27171.1 hypothetical protein [Encephalitozoon cuniculi GB-M1]